MKKALLILSLCLGAALAGCSSNTENTTDTGGLEYDTFENAMTELEGLSDVRLEKLTLAEGITVNRPQQLVGMTLANRLPDAGTAKRLADAFVPGNSFKINDAAALSEYLIREDIGRGGMLSLEGYGFFGYGASGQDFQPQYDPEGKVFLNAAGEKTSLALKDGKLTLDRAVSLARETAAKYTDALGMEPLVPMIAKYNSSGFMIRFSPSLNGWLLPCQPVSAESSVNLEMLKSAVHHEYRSCVASAERAGMFSGDGCIYIQAEKPIEKTVTLSSALLYLDDSLAEWMHCTVRQISLVQISTSRGGNVQDASKLSEEELRAGLEGGYETSPAWQFSLTDSSREYIAYIDCQSGEFAFGQLMTGA